MSEEITTPTIPIITIIKNHFEFIYQIFYTGKLISFSNFSANSKTSLSFPQLLFTLILTGKPFTKPIGKLSEGRPAKLAKSNKLSLQCEDTKPEKE